MKITTTRFGDITVKEESLLTFPSGIIGFPEAGRYVILDHDRPAPVKWLQSVDDGGLAFVVMDPCLCAPDYRVSVEDSQLMELGPARDEDLIVFVILTIPSDDPAQMTANLRGPVVVNERTRLAKQVILTEEWSTRHAVLGATGTPRRVPIGSGAPEYPRVVAGNR